MPTCRWRAKTPSRPIRGRTSSTDAGRAHRHQRNREADRGERRIERPDPDHEAQMRSRPQAERNPLACRRAGVVEDELCGQRGDEDRPLVPGRIGLSRGHQHERGPDRVPRVPREDGDPPQVMRLPTAGSELAESKPRRDRERHPGRGSTKSIGTSTSSVGTPDPAPTSNSTCEATA